MRMRAKPWAGPELDACPFFLRNPQRMKNQWLQWFPRQQPLHVELGCGKGWFLAGLAPLHPEINYLGIDMKDAVLARGKRLIEEAYDEKPIDNLVLTAYDISRLPNIMGPQDRISRLYINFCNPWPRPRHYKRRLTHPRQLALYRPLLEPDAELWLKTDDEPLFRATLCYLQESHFEVLEQTQDLHQFPHPQSPIDVMTEHEKMFTEKGVPIKALRARMLPDDDQTKTATNYFG